MSETIYQRIKLAAKTSTILASENKTPLERELVIELNTGKTKLGNGTQSYNDLPYFLFAATVSWADITAKPTTLSGYGLTVSNADWNGSDLSVANGGTGASSAAAARSNLGAASSGTNGDITSLVSITQIKFAAVQQPSTDPNTLDDYEEGTFAPTLRFGGNSVGISYNTGQFANLGRYTKIGNLVLFQVQIILTNKGTSTGSATIAGLPFTSLGRPISAAVAFAVGLNTITQVQWRINASTNAIDLYQVNTYTPLTEANFNNTTEIYVTGSYCVA